MAKCPSARQPNGSWHPIICEEVWWRDSSCQCQRYESSSGRREDPYSYIRESGTFIKEGSGIFVLDDRADRCPYRTGSVKPESVEPVYASVIFD